MTDYNAKKILNDIEEAIRQEPVKLPPPMNADRYLLASALQKTIRYGNIEQATRIAASLITVDQQRFFRRISIIAAEDVGIGDINAVVRVFAAVSSTAWVRRVGEIQAGMYLTRILCEATKSRLADAVFIIAERAATYQSLRKQYASANDRTLTKHITDVSKPLVERALSLWLLAGTHKFPSDLMPQRFGAPDNAVEVLRSLDAPHKLVESSIAAISKSQWPLSIFLPLIWQEAQKYPESLHIVHDEIPEAQVVAGVPISAADTFTRVGKSCYRQLKKTVPELSAFTIEQLGLAAFYADGGRTDKTISAPALDEIQHAGEMTDLICAGLHPPEYAKLRECLAQNMDVLAGIREEQLSRLLLSPSSRGQL